MGLAVANHNNFQCKFFMMTKNTCFSELYTPTYSSHISGQVTTQMKISFMSLGPIWLGVDLNQK